MAVYKDFKVHRTEEHVTEVFKLLDELEEVMGRYNQGRPNIDDMRAKATVESQR